MERFKLEGRAEYNEKGSEEERKIAKEKERERGIAKKEIRKEKVNEGRMKSWKCEKLWGKEKGKKKEKERKRWREWGRKRKEKRNTFSNDIQMSSSILWIRFAWFIHSPTFARDVKMKEIKLFLSLSLHFSVFLSFQQFLRRRMWPLL